MNERPADLDSEVDLALQRALEGANLRAGDSLGAWTPTVVHEPDPSAVDLGDVNGAGGDGDE